METVKKVCFKCNKEKVITDFYKHKGMSDGRLGKCKECTKLDSKIRENELRKNPDFVENERKRHREKYHRLDYREKHKPSPQQKKEQIERYRKKYPKKYKARNASQRLSRKKGNHLHHWSYNEEHWKDCIELSIKDHALLHRCMTYDPERMMYRDLNGNLLDTKQKHINYINIIFN